MLEMPLFQSVKPAKEGLLIVPGHGVIMTEGIATKRHKIHKGSICVFLRLFVACFSCLFVEHVGISTLNSGTRFVRSSYRVIGTFEED